MKRILLLLILVLSATAVKADDYQDAFTVYKEYLAATKSKNLGQVINRLDKTAPNYKAELKAVAESMLNMDMDFKISSVKYVGKSGDYIVIRVIQQNLPKSDNPEIKSVEIDALQIMRKDKDGSWKYRGSQILSVKQLDL